MSEQAYKAALERIVMVGGDAWLGAVSIAEAALNDSVDFTHDNGPLFEWLAERRGEKVVA